MDEIYCHTCLLYTSGMDTEMGKIDDALAQAKDGKTPLQIKLAQLSKILTVLVLVICVIIFAVSLLRADDVEGEVILDTFMVAVSPVSYTHLDVYKRQGMGRSYGILQETDKGYSR